MTLAEALAEAARMMPGGRVRIHKQTVYGMGPTETLHVIYAGLSHRVGFLKPERHADVGPYELVHLECALREECAVRGWEIGLDIRPPQNHRPGSTPQCAVVRTPRFFAAHADTPAQALLEALTAAIKAEGVG